MIFLASCPFVSLSPFVPSLMSRSFVSRSNFQTTLDWTWDIWVLDNRRIYFNKLFLWVGKNCSSNFDGKFCWFTDPVNCKKADILFTGIFMIQHFRIMKQQCVYLFSDVFWLWLSWGYSRFTMIEWKMKARTTFYETILKDWRKG